MSGHTIALPLTIFTNCRLCRGGQLVSEDLAISSETGEIVNAHHAGLASFDIVDLKGGIIAPGFIELQTNGMRGFHFTHFEQHETYAEKLSEIARYLPQTGVTGFYATIPTVHADELKKILPALHPREIPAGASLLGAHAEGPYLHPSKKGAHNDFLFHQPTTPASEVYGQVANSNATLKLVTLAPELNGVGPLIHQLASSGIRVSLGHSSATYFQGLMALKAGASCLTHTLNAMAPLHHRDPGLAGLISAPSTQLMGTPYFSIIPDGNHLHPSVATMLFRTNPAKCITITDSIELAGLSDGTYPGHAQIPHNQTKVGSKVVIEGTDTLIGGCAGLDQCVRNLREWSGCSLAEAVRTVTENVVDLMGDRTRGRLDVGRRADLAILDQEGKVSETWVSGRKVWPDMSTVSQNLTD